jgi:hypothetical protein
MQQPWDGCIQTIKNCYNENMIFLNCRSADSEKIYGAGLPRRTNMYIFIKSYIKGLTENMLG